MDEIVFSRQGSLAIVTLNRPAALNAQNLAMVRAFADQLTLWEADPAVTKLFIHGAGERAFCAGGDIRALWQVSAAERLAFFEHEYRLCLRLAQSRLKIIAYMDGITMGGGVGLSIHADARLATPRTVWAMPEVLIGFFPDIAGSHFLPRLKPGKAFGRYLALTGAQLTGAECLAAGIATHLVESGKDTQLIGQLARGETIDSIATPARLELPGRLAPFADLPLGDFIGKLTALGLMPGGMNPRSQQIIDAAFQIGARLSLVETVAMDLRLVRHFLTEEGSFAEGVRARLIEKRPPDWQEIPPVLLTPARLSAYFT